MSDNATEPSPGPLSPRWRAAISLGLLLHVSAIFIPPMMLQTSGSGGVSPMVEFLMSSFRPYIDLTFLNHGYAFFAPDPGPSHLIRAEIEFADGRPAQRETFPDLQRHWPRLLYHRHFMLSEQLNSQFAPPQLPPEITQDPVLVERWQQARRLYELKWRAFRHHLQVKHDAADVTLTRVRHRMIDVEEVRSQRKRLDATDTYFDLSETGFTGVEP